jgi:FkbM family methyltransferase
MLSGLQFDAELESILDKSQSRARTTETVAFEQFLTSRTEPLVVFGAGRLGMIVLSALRCAGIEPLALADNNARLWRGRIEGLEVLSPQAAAQKYGRSATFVIAVFHPNKISPVCGIWSQLTELGCRRVVTFPIVLWKIGHDHLPHFLWDLPDKVFVDSDAVKSAFYLMADEESRIEFLSQLRLRMSADFRALPPPSKHLQYSPQDIVRTTGAECFIDCGAFNGDSIADFVASTRNEFRKIIAFEPDPTSFMALSRNVAKDPDLVSRADLHNIAVGASVGSMAFDANGLPSACISSGGNIEVSSVALDNALAEESPTFIKMDIEGAELDALRGAQQCIRKHRPILAICVYHKQNHLWRIPLLIHDLLPNSRLYLRAHCADGLDLVCYAIPPERAI